MYSIGPGSTVQNQEQGSCYVDCHAKYMPNNSGTV